MKTQVPDDLAPLAAEALRTLEADLTTEFNELYESEDSDLAVLTEIAAALDQVRGAITKAEQKAAEADAQRRELADRVNAPAATDDDGEGDGDADPAADVDPDAAVEPASEPATEPAAEPVPVAAAEPELVTASAAKPAPKRAPSAAGVRRQAGTPQAPATGGDMAVITAAADIPGMSSGQRIDTLGVATAMHARARGMSDRGARMPVASIKLPIPEGHMIRKDSDADAVITAAVDSALAGKDAEALLASGGWCAPSETMFEQFSVEARDGLLDLPTVGIARAGVNVPSYFGIGDAAGALWTWTEENDEDAATGLTATDIDVASNVAIITTSAAHHLAVGQQVDISNASTPGLNGTYTVTVVNSATVFRVATSGVADLTNATGDVLPVKGCLAIPCPTWTEYRLAAEGLCLSHGNLMDRAYPEQTRRFVDLTFTAHMHRMSNARLAKIIASATAVTVTSAPSDAAGDILNAIDLQVADYRSQHLASENVVLEAIFPLWVKEAVRASLAMRNGVDLLNVTKAQVVGYFTERNVRPQFLHGYDPLYSGTPATAWKSTSKFLLYFAGAYTGGSGGVIDLGVVRDSRLNRTNDFTAAWSEEFYLVMRRGPVAREVTFTTSVDGQTGGLQFAGS